MPQRPLERTQSHDLPDVLIHLTYRRGTASPGLQADIATLTPWDRQAGVLLGTLRYGLPFDTDWPVASFTQTTRRALYSLAHYQHTGVAFHKQAVWDAGGGPVHYVRGDAWTAWRTSNLPEPMKSMGVRLWPGWGGTPPLGTGMQFFDQARERSEWLHEREWRLPRPPGTDWGWRFPREAVAFLICPAPQVREQMLVTLERWDGDRRWAGSLPVAYPSSEAGGFVGAEDLWV